MPSFHVLFHRLAIREYRLARNWYREQSVEVAERFAVAIDQAVSRIATRADMLPTLTASSRYIRVSRFPYILIFRFVDDDTVMVVAVAHTSRRPGYWRHRT